jgi:hypothetical protein
MQALKRIGRPEDFAGHLGKVIPQESRIDCTELRR